MTGPARQSREPPPEPPPGPLEDLRILDMTQILGDLGTDIVKIERLRGLRVA